MNFKPAMFACFLLFVIFSSVSIAGELLPGKCLVSVGSNQQECAINCFNLKVEQSRVRKHLKKISLHIMKIRPINELPLHEYPLLILVGGPGQSSFSKRLIDAAKNYAKTFEREVILFSQRGSHGSVPELGNLDREQQCEELLDPSKINPEINSCLKNAEVNFRKKGYFLDAFNTVENSKDVGDLIVALKYDKVILLGASYGSRLAMHVAKRFPHLVHAMVLNGMYPPHQLYYHVKLYDERINVNRAMFNWLDNAMKNNEEYISKFGNPDPEGDFFEARKKNQEIGGFIDDWETDYLNLNDMSDAETQARKLLLTKYFLQEKFTRFPNLIPNQLLSKPKSPYCPSSDIMQKTMDFFDNNRYDKLESWLKESGIIEKYKLKPKYKDQCLFMEIEAKPEKLTNYVNDYGDAEYTEFREKIDAPALIVQGALDLRTPVNLAQESKKYFSHLVYVEIPSGNHFTRFDNPALISLSHEFIKNPKEDFSDKIESAITTIENDRIEALVKAIENYIKLPPKKLEDL